MIVYNDNSVVLYKGNTFDLINSLDESSVDSIVSSPPYYRQRLYPIDANVFDGIQFGMESSPQEYIGHTVDLFRSFYRILKPTGSVWWNIADTRDGSGSLLMIPWEIANILRKEGWKLINIVIWAKSNPLCESVRRRMTEAYEFIFVFVKSDDYYYDQEAVRQPYAESSIIRSKYLISQRNRPIKNNSQTSELQKWDIIHAGANLLDVWVFPKGFYDDDVNIHIARFPEELPRRAILASVPAYTCKACGTPYRRIVDKKCIDEQQRASKKMAKVVVDTWGTIGSTSTFNVKRSVVYSTIGWDKRCTCKRNETIPGIVLDPFAGVGTTGIVAKKLGRRAILFEIVDEYVDAAIKCIESVPQPLSVTLYEHDISLTVSSYQPRLLDD